MITISLLLTLAAAVAAPAEIPQPVAWTVAAHEGGGGRVLFAPEAPLLAIASDPDHAPAFATAVTADEQGAVKHDLLKNGWAYCAYSGDRAMTVLVEGRGFYLFMVNGARFPGDIYRHGFLRVPVALRKGVNHVLVRAIRGGFTMRFLPAPGPASLAPKDATLPDLREGRLIRSPGAVVVLNHETRSLVDAKLAYGDDRVFERREIDLPRILPGGLAKPPFDLKQLRAPTEAEADEKGRYPLRVTLRVGEHESTETYAMIVRAAGDAYRETRISGIDRSVQYHAVRAPVRIEEGKRYALFLTLHGAGVAGHNQARAYAAKEDAFVVAPTNRRRFGFDWQDWGRLDALETLDWVLARYPIDPDRVYLTGHSMGGHGAWYVGSLHAWRFAAVAPSAGWASFFTYGGGMKRDLGEDPVLTPFEEVQLENDTLAILRNLEWTPLYILQGEKDDNVPAAQPRLLIDALAPWHRSFVYHEEPGAGHWWGNRCVDWPPLIDFCRRHVRNPNPARFTFTTFNPAVSSRYAWLRILAQKTPGRLSRVTVLADPEKRSIRVETRNVLRLAMEPDSIIPTAGVTETIIDETRVVGSSAGEVWYERVGDAWRAIPVREDQPRRGPFKLAFANGMVWVYGTGGTPEENAATLAKVRYDAGVWWYRGNGNVAILPDTEFDIADYRGRNVILYGNADTNSAFVHLDPDCPIQVRRGRIVVGGTARAPDRGTYFVHRSRHGDALVGVVGATSARAMRMMQQARYFISGSAVPDYVVFSDAVLRKGLAGVTEAGWFTDDGKGTR